MCSEYKFVEVISEKEINEAVATLAAELDAAYAKKAFCFLSLLDGAIPFTELLLSKMSAKPRVGYIRASSYNGGTESSGTVSIEANWENMDFTIPYIILDDVLDTGRTLLAIQKLLFKAGVPEVRSAVVVSKQGTREVSYESDWILFDRTPEFLVGFGMDINGLYRDWKYIAKLSQKS